MLFLQQASVRDGEADRRQGYLPQALLQVFPLQPHSHVCHRSILNISPMYACERWPLD